MKSIVPGGNPAAAATSPRGYWPAWLLSTAALGVVVVPGAGLWAALLFALACTYWAWLAYGGGRRVSRAGGNDSRAWPDDGSLHDLIVASSRTVSNDLRALRADLEQVRGLVHDAAVTLGDGFQVISERLRLEDRVIAVLMARMLAERSALDHHLSEELAHVSADSARFNDRLDALARALQWEDVVRQLLEYCDRQVVSIETYIDGLAGLLADPALGQHPEERQVKLMQACEHYLENSKRCANDRQRHITQTSLRAGSVDLF